MASAKVVAAIVGGLVVACLAFVVMLLMVKALWAWTIPDLFPGAVAQGLVAGTISWLTAVKIALLLAVFSGVARGANVHYDGTKKTCRGEGA
jgi:hypothetical protein